MLGPYRITCENCEFESSDDSGEAAQTKAEKHSRCHDHLVWITDVNTGASAEIER